MSSPRYRARGRGAATGAPATSELPRRPAPPQPANAAASLVVVDHPPFRRVHTLARHFLAARFALTEGLRQAPVRPDYDLYGLCLLALREELDAARPNTWHWRSANLHQLLGLGGGSTRAKFVATGLGGELRLYFNRRFPSLWTRKPGDAHSLSSERRPDLRATWSSPPRRVWLALERQIPRGQDGAG